MRLYNTLSKSVSEFTPLDNKVRIYSCGPTVYDHIHIGNLASFIYADTLCRALKSAGYEVEHVMNITDIDDKMIARSKEKYPDLEPTEALDKLAKEYEEVFKRDMISVGNNVDGIKFVRATESIESMQKLIAKLHADGFAYIADDGVYFSIKAYTDSGKTYGQLTPIDSSNTSQSRIQNDEYDKESVHDFALWKLKKPDEPSWDFELDGQQLAGRPGWHIECSAMSTAALGLPFDIHTGGVDLKFPHHENEIAQSTAGQEDPLMAQLFFHNEHVMVDGKKMSKSLDNFYTLEDIKAKYFDPLAFRLMVLQSHYRSQANFTWEALEAAQNRLVSIRDWSDLRHQPSAESMSDELDELFRKTRQQMSDSMANDINTPEALASLNQLVSWMFKNPVPGVEGTHTDGTLAFIDELLGINISNRPDITSEEKQLIVQREAARKSNEWDKSDALRAQLKDRGIEVRDTDNGQVWARSS